MTAGVNFTNILRAPFLYESFSRSFFFACSEGSTFYLRKNIGANKMLVKLTLVPKNNYWRIYALRQMVGEIDPLTTQENEIKLYYKALVEQIVEELPKPIALNESPRDYEDSLPEEFNPIFDYESANKQVWTIPALIIFPHC
jgi:hypothetical protein